eukprot:TRINITY_DN1628_c0_g1_i2.p1 TRINITY_DN1628_c0_g1~~TRINITY_DN1628_c0_g1_i2.p1  ORF type:complete len:414 (+),score=116.44 TRINITY_DN1628_c0_g1_i2:93-1334(+)
MAPKRDARGLTDRKICVAVTVGVLLGIMFSMIQLFGSGGGEQVASDVLDSGDDVMKTVDDLPARRSTRELELEQKVEALQKELEQLRSSSSSSSSSRSGSTEGGVTAGPYGTVKSQRTNPTVIPDRSVNPQLAEILERVAINNELIVAVSNNNIRDMLQAWFTTVKSAGVKNFLVVALDDEVADFLRENDVPYYRRDATIPDIQVGTGDNHAISGMKFHILREFLQLGYSVLLTDVDIVFVQNPFNFLHRDCDVESMTDGVDNGTAYGYNDVHDDPAMGWARYVHTMRIYVFNSGLFYIRPTIPSIELLDRVFGRLQKEKAWDQAVFNEELWFPSSPGYIGLHASRRVLDYYQFMNSKVLFTQVRKDARFANHRPVTIHINYHPDKYQRMMATIEYYIKGNKAALDPFPDGSE